MNKMFLGNDSIGLPKMMIPIYKRIRLKNDVLRVFEWYRPAGNYNSGFLQYCQRQTCLCICQVTEVKANDCSTELHENQFHWRIPISAYVLTNSGQMASPWKYLISFTHTHTHTCLTSLKMNNNMYFDKESFFVKFDEITSIPLLVRVMTKYFLSSKIIPSKRICLLKVQIFLEIIFKYSVFEMVSPW